MCLCLLCYYYKRMSCSFLYRRLSLDTVNLYRAVSKSCFTSSVLNKERLYCSWYFNTTVLYYAYVYVSLTVAFISAALGVVVLLCSLLGALGFNLD